MADLNKIVDELSTLTVMEAAELSKLLEEKWGVTAAAPVAVAAGGAAPAAEAAFFDNQLYSKEDIAKVATLPSLDEIRGKIVGLINAPASKLVRLLQRPDQDIISILQNKKD